MNLTCVILARNEEKNIKDCISNLDFCDEILVIDDNSSDKTVERCQMSDVRCKIYKRSLNGDFASQRNFGLDKAKGKWVLFVDADERITRQLSDEMIKVTSDPTLHYNGYYIKRQDFLWDETLKYTEAGNIKLLRLAKKGAGLWKRKVHEVWEVKGKVGFLHHPIIHHSHANLSQFLEDINNLSSLHAKANYEEGKRSSLIKIIFWPQAKFIDNFFIKLGLLHGVRGFVISVLMTFHSYLAWSKLWLLQKNRSAN